MPIYKWKCEHCGKGIEELRPMKESKDDCPCPCGEILTFEDRDYTQKRTNAPADCPRVSTALGVHPSQIADGSIFETHPGAEFNPNGDMLLKNLSEQKQRLRERGWVDKNKY